MLRGRSVLREASALPALTAELAIQDRLELLAILGRLAPSDKWVRRVQLALKATSALEIQGRLA